MQLTMLGTGAALVTKCYNTCCVFEERGEYFLVDGGGGNGLLVQLQKAGVDYKDIKSIFVTHKHIDHLLGVVWLIRMICHSMNLGEHEGEVFLYANDEVAEILTGLAQTLLRPQESRFINSRLHLTAVADGEEKRVLGRKIIFFDICSAKAKQFGFTLFLFDGGRVTYCGDEPFCERNFAYAAGSRWLLHEAYCLASQAAVFDPYEKHHSTVKDACLWAAKLNAENLILYHTEDKNLARRRELYTAEGREFFGGNLYIPDDLETFVL